LFALSEKKEKSHARTVGELVYFQEEHTIPYVFMDPQWLTDMMSTVVCLSFCLLLRTCVEDNHILAVHVPP
jgi:hypothetical protein